MSIKNIYNQVENDKQNSVKENKVSMDLMEYIEEHENLIETLRTGSREELLAEADKQEEELNECLKEHNMTDEDEDKAEGETEEE